MRSDTIGGRWLLRRWREQHRATEGDHVATRTRPSDTVALVASRACAAAQRKGKGGMHHRGRIVSD